jgi:hypothetical protein
MGTGGRNGQEAGNYGSWAARLGLMASCLMAWRVLEVFSRGQLDYSWVSEPVQ